MGPRLLPFPILAKTARGCRSAHGRLTTDGNVPQMGAENSSRQKTHGTFFMFFFYLTYIVHVNKGHKIHKNTTLLCRIALAQTHPFVFSSMLLAYQNSTHSDRHFRGLAFNGHITQLIFCLMSQ